ncbi:hypothetical protein [Alcaligenes faecalis]|uniref:hypothetical protein n=1 Tax=Alcaligenes faecalis TaxID=511 RepID=UPI00208FEC04|nr:hypothetical protein [Alcaligenes faecalis]USP49331.1 hypothetical protein J5J84_07555 [Alcaligenes faecalis]
MRQNLSMPDDMRHNPVQVISQLAINQERAAQVYGTRAFIPVTSKAAPNTNYPQLKEKRR